MCRVGFPCRTFHEEPLARPWVSLTEPSNNRPQPVHKGSRDPAPRHSGGVLVFGKTCAVGLSALVLKVMETLKVTEAPLPGSVCAPVQRSPLAGFPRASAELPRASAELPRASEESSARLRGAWRCCPPLVAGQPRVGLRADPRSGGWRRLLP